MAETGEPAGARSPSERTVSADFVTLDIYCTYTAITELFGERAWEVTWRWGEIAFEELRRQMEITETEPLPLARRLAKWFVDVGYAKSLEVTQPSENEMVYDIESPLPRPAVMRLRAANATQPHYSASLIMAALKQVCGIEARMENVRSEVLSPTRQRQRWRLTRP